MVRKYKKHIVIFSIGFVAAIIAECFLIRNPNAFTLGALILSIAYPLFSYCIILGGIALFIAAFRKNVREFWFPIFAWLFFISGLLDIAGKSYIAFVLRPPVDKIVQGIVAQAEKESEKAEYTRLGKCDRVKCYFTASGKCSVRFDDLTRCTDP